MDEMTILVGQTLKWVRSRAVKGEDELRLGEQVIARFRSRSSFGPFSTAESLYGSWSFKRKGVLLWRVSIHLLGSDSEVAAFNYDSVSRDGTLEFSDGRKILATTNLVRSKLKFRTEAGDVLVKFRRRGFFHESADVDVPPQVTTFSELPLLIMLGWYLILMLAQDEARWV
jgi:hypothetical protein